MSTTSATIDFAFLLLRASEAERGIKVRTNNPQLLRSKLYAERKNHPDLRNLTFIQPPIDPESYLWIIKKEARANG